MWILTYAQTNANVFAHNSLEQAKFLQLIVSKHYDISINYKIDTNIPESSLFQKLNFVNRILTTELETIEYVHRERGKAFVIEKLLASKKFYEIVYPDDPTITKSIDLEIAEVNGYKIYCDAHRNFIVNALYNIDYSAELVDIKHQFKKLIYTPPSDPFNVYEVLQPAIAEAIYK